MEKAVGVKALVRDDLSNWTKTGVAGVGSAESCATGCEHVVAGSACLARRCSSCQGCVFYLSPKALGNHQRIFSKGVT